MSTNELIKPDVNAGWSTDYQMIRLDNFARRGWSKDANGVTYSVIRDRPEIERWIREQNPDMYELLNHHNIWFKNPELETLFLLRWS